MLTGVCVGSASGVSALAAWMSQAFAGFLSNRRAASERENASASDVAPAPRTVSPSLVSVCVRETRDERRRGKQDPLHPSLSPSLSSHPDADGHESRRSGFTFHIIVT